MKGNKFPNRVDWPRRLWICQFTHIFECKPNRCTSLTWNYINALIYRLDSIWFDLVYWADDIEVSKAPWNINVAITFSNWEMKWNNETRSATKDFVNIYSTAIQLCKFKPRNCSVKFVLRIQYPIHSCSHTSNTHLNVYGVYAMHPKFQVEHITFVGIIYLKIKQNIDFGSP